MNLVQDQTDPSPDGLGACRPGGGTSWKWALLVMLVYGLFVGLRVGVHGGDPSDCIGACRPLCDPQATPVPIKIQPDARGYDGLFFYRLALRPWDTAPEACGIRLDSPAYRHQRIGYPWVCWIVSLGQPRALAAVMIAVNLCWLGLLAAVCVGCARALQIPPCWGLLPLLWPGLLISLGRDLCEIQAVTLLLLGSRLLVAARLPAAVLVLTGALLTRETTALPIAGLGLYCLGQAVRSRRLTAWLQLAWWLIPAVALLGWHAFLRLQYGSWPAAGGTPNWSPMPFRGLAAFLGQGLPFNGTALAAGGHGAGWPVTQALYYAYRCFQLGLCLGVTLLAAWAWRSSRCPAALKMAWLVAATVFLGLTDWVLAQGPSSFLRVGTDGFVLGLLLIAANGKWLRRFALAALGAGWGAAFLCYIVW